MMLSRVCIDAQDASNQITPLLLVIVIFFLANFLVVVAGYVAAGNAGIVKLEIQFSPAVITFWSWNSDDVVSAALAIS